VLCYCNVTLASMLKNEKLFTNLPIFKFNIVSVELSLFFGRIAVMDNNYSLSVCNIKKGKSIKHFLFFTHLLESCSDKYNSKILEVVKPNAKPSRSCDLLLHET